MLYNMSDNKYKGGVAVQKAKTKLTRGTERHLAQMGQQIRDARVRRNLTAEELALKAGVSLSTIWAIEKGSASVSIGRIAAVLHALGDLDSDLLLIAQDEELKLARQQNEQLPQRVRHTRSKPKKASPKKVVVKSRNKNQK